MSSIETVKHNMISEYLKRYVYAHKTLIEFHANELKKSLARTELDSCNSLA